jgi:DNA polymerase-3 subunit beta
MKFSIQREQLLRPIQLVTGVVERRQTLPVLSNLLVRAHKSDTECSVEITGTDLEVQMVASCQVDVEEPGEVTIPARKLADIWRSLDEGAQVTVSVEGGRATVRSGRSRFALSTLPARDFPQIEGGEADVTLELEEANARDLIDQVAFAMAQQDVRYFLNGMLLEITNEHVRAVATDGHRLAMCTIPGGKLASPLEQRVQAIVPRKGVIEIGRLLDEGGETLQLQLGRNHLRLQKGEYTLTTKLVDGQFPDYDKVVPRDGSRYFMGDREALKQAFQRAAILSNEKYRGVRLLVEGEQLTIQANNPEQEEAEESLAIEFNGDQLEIGFNVSYLLDVLNVLDTEQVKISVSDANNSALIEAPNSNDAVYVVMPMRL